MAEQISQRELRNDSGRIMRRLDEGQSFIVSRNGTPVGELHPLRRHRFVSAHAAVLMFRDAPRVDAATMRHDITLAELCAGPSATDDAFERARRQGRRPWSLAMPEISWGWNDSSRH